MIYSILPIEDYCDEFYSMWNREASTLIVHWDLSSSYHRKLIEVFKIFITLSEDIRKTIAASIGEAWK